MPILLGLTSCDTCRKAQRAMETAGHDVTFRDVRAEPLSEEEITKYLELFGDALINTRSTTWRNLSDDAREADARHLLKAHPALMKRPVIEGSAGTTLGWTKDAQARHLG